MKKSVKAGSCLGVAAACAALAWAGWADGAAAATASRVGSVIVVPRRPALVRVAFDVIRMRPAVVVCYENVKSAGEPALSVWDTSDHTWKRMTLAHFQSGRFITFSPERVFLMGADAELPGALADCQSWGGKTVRLSRLAFADLMNDLDKQLDFSTKEWEWLADRYQLKLRDQNEQRRRYGRYGPPDGVKPVPPASVEPQEKIQPPPPAKPRPVVTPLSVEPAPEPIPAAELNAPPAELNKPAARTIKLLPPVDEKPVRTNPADK